MTRLAKLRALGARVDAGEARALHLAARLLARRLSRHGSIRALALSGSLVREPDWPVHGDADFFVLAARGATWRAFLACLWEGWRLARALCVSRLRFCFNYVLDESRPELLDLAHPEHARECLRLRVLFGVRAYERLLLARASDLRALAPDAYRARLARRGRDRQADEPRRFAVRPGATARAGALLLWALLPAFVAAVKLRELARRRRHPDSLVHSGGGVVRSHLHRLPPPRDDPRARRAFDRLAPTYDAIASSPANRYMRARLREALGPFASPGATALDLGAGCGFDAMWLARRGASVVALDPSRGMVGRAWAGVRQAGLHEQVAVAVGDLASAEELSPPGGFDLVLAAFGPLNLAGPPSAWVAPLARAIRPGGRLVATVMNGASLWRPFWSGAPAAIHDGPWWSVPVGGYMVPVRLFDTRELGAALGGWFRLRFLAGLCVAFPPPGPDRRLGGPALLALAALDRILGRSPWLGARGDHLLIVAERTHARAT